MSFDVHSKRFGTRRTKASRRPNALRRASFETLEAKLALAADMGFAAAFQTLGSSADSLFSSPYDLTRGGGLVTDAAGNRYVTINGGSDQSVDLDPGPAVNSVTLDSALVKLDPAGAVLWKAAFDTTGSAGGPVRILYAVDADQNVYLVGDFRGTFDVDPGPGVTNITSRLGGTDYSFYMAKLNSAGEFQWARTLDAPELTPLRVAVDGAGNLLMANNFTAVQGDPAMDVDAGPGVVPIRANSVNDLVILKYDADGDFVWVRQIGNAGASQSGEVPSLAVNNQGDVAIAGIFTGTLDLNPGAGVYNVTNSDAASDSFIVRLDSSGDFVGVHVSEGSGTSSFRDIEFTDDGSIVATGYFKNTVDYLPGSGTQTLTSVNGNTNGVVVKLNVDLSLAWAKAFSGNGEILPVEADVDAAGNVYLGGTFGRLGVAGPYDFDPGPGAFELTRPAAFDTGFVMSLTASGDFRWAVPLGGNAGASRVQGLSVTADGNVHLSGAFKGTSDFDPNPLAERWLNSGASQSVFVATLTQPAPNSGAPVVDAGASQSVLITGAANLHGTVADDGLPAPVTSTWSLHSGPGVVAFGNASALDTTATFSAIGTYMLKLTATDGQFITTDFVQVIVNPLTATLAATADAYIHADAKTTNYGASASLVVSGRPDEAALLKWDLSSIPAGSTLQSAMLTINVTDTSVNTYEIYELKRSWTESQATWKVAANKTNWQAVGAQGALDIGSTVLGTVNPVPYDPTAIGLRSVTLNAAGLAIVQGWLNNPASNFGFTLQNYANANKDDLVFSSRESSVAANRPQLQLVFIPPSAAPLRLTEGAVLISAAAATPTSLGAAEKPNSKKGNRALLKAEAATGMAVVTDSNTATTPLVPKSNTRDGSALAPGKSDADVADVVFSEFSKHALLQFSR